MTFICTVQNLSASDALHVPQERRRHRLQKFGFFTRTPREGGRGRGPCKWFQKADEGPMGDTAGQDNLIGLTAEIVSAYVSNNTVASADISHLINGVHSALNRTASGASSEPEPEPQKPAVPIRKSIAPDYIVCLEDGKRFKSLKRHLRTHYDLTPDEYRQKWRLASDYPMVAPNYAKARSSLAKQMGLGQKRAG
jgi:predicted transcriptional regulator